MKTGRWDSKDSYLAEVESFIPNHNDSMSLVLSRFNSVGVDTQGTVALLGKPPSLLRFFPSQTYVTFFPFRESI